MLMFLLALPLIINSYWAFIPAPVSAILLIVRTAMGDQPVSALTFGTSNREPSSSRFSYLRLLAIRMPLNPV